MIKWPSRVAITIIAVAVIGFGLAAPRASADTIVQSYQASSDVQPGWTVELKPGSPNSVQLAAAGQSADIYGVAIDPSQAPVTLQRQPAQHVYVATSGTYMVLVSTQNGAIKAGDYLSISSTDGIAAKATPHQSFIVGQALQDFDGTSGVISTGASNSHIGRISVSVLVEHNPLLKNNVILPSFVQSIGDSVAGKDLTPIRIYAALAAFLVAAVVAFGSLAIGIRNAMVAIGRNPLSRHFILKGLIQVMLVSLTVLILGLFSVYLLLKL